MEFKCVFFCCYRQLDSRLTKVPPNRATITVTPSKERGDIDETTVRQTIIKNVNAGKAKAYDKVEMKVHSDLQVKVQCNLHQLVLLSQFVIEIKL